MDRVGSRTAAAWPQEAGAGLAVASVATAHTPEATGTLRAAPRGGVTTGHAPPTEPQEKEHWETTLLEQKKP